MTGIESKLIRERLSQIRMRSLTVLDAQPDRRRSLVSTTFSFASQSVHLAHMYPGDDNWELSLSSGPVVHPKENV